MAETHALRVETLFDQAVELPAPERGSFLEEHCGSNLQLRSAVERLLDADDAVGERFLQGPGVDVKAAAAPPASAEKPGALIGRYKLLKQIGEGGMSLVYLAEQSEPVRRKVALKIVKPGMDSKQVLARFELERRVLALFNHPHVARVFDAGTTDNGRPYFVMEHVEGLPLTRFCDEQRLTTNERLKLFVQVCAAVQHAHQKGIIHRDIKPGNILVALQDGKPLPKVIDFGIAKATAGELTERTLFTEQGQLIGTPEYMSPEQAEMSELGVDTTTDIYSLGVVLYELLAGLLPFDPAELRAKSLTEIQRTIRNVEPSKPSTRLSAAEAPAQLVAQRKAGDIRALQRQVSGELDWIVMKAMEKERTRRYASASELAADIRRHLALEPVLAGPPTLRYRMSKFARRNRTLVGAGVSIAAVLVLATIGMGMVTSWALGERTRADDEARNARLARLKAETITRLVTDVLESTDPTRGGTQDLLGTEAIDQVIAQLDAGQLDDQLEVKAELLQTIAKILGRNYREEQALVLAKQALEINRSLHPGDHRSVAYGLNTVGLCYDHLGNLTEALRVFRLAHEMKQRLGNPIDGLHNVAYCLKELGRLDEALPIQREVLEHYSKIHSGDHGRVVSALDGVAASLQTLGRYAEALPMFEASLEMHLRLSSRTNRNTAIAINKVGVCLFMLGRPTEALAMHEQALRIERRLFPDGHHGMAWTLNNMVLCLDALGRLAEAMPLHEEAMELYHRFPAGYIALHPMARTLDRAGRSAEALPLYEEQLEVGRQIWPADHPRVARCIAEIAICLQHLERPQDALIEHEKAGAMYDRVFEGDHPRKAWNLYHQARCLTLLDKPDEALSAFEDSLEMHRRVLSPEHVNVLHSQIGLARHLMTLDRYAEAEPLLLDAAAQCEHSAHSRRVHWASLIGDLVQIYDVWHAAEPGKGYTEKAAEWRAKLEELKATLQPASPASAG